jgi:CheY-like chemotaxis protein
LNLTHNANHIFLVEDNPGDVLLIQEHLKSSPQSFNLTVARDGDQAVEKLQKMEEEHNLPQLILLDLNLPKRNGIEVLQFIKEQDKLRPIPVIMLTSSTLRDDIEKAYRHLANSYIVKPFDFDEFSETIENLCQFWFGTASLPVPEAIS